MTMKNKLALSAGAMTIALFSLTNNAFAQQTDATPEPTDEIIVTGELSRYGATKSATPILETARSISVETEKLFRDKGALTLDDALNYTSGVNGDVFGFSTRGDFPRVRGFDAAEYRDGQQVLFGFYNNTRSDIYMLEQVEILKGPASVLYGKGTPGGIVNAISKLAGPDKSSEFVIDVGNNERFQAAGDVNLSLTENLFVRVVALYRDSGTQIDYVNDDAVIVMPSITYDTGRSSVTAMVEIVDRDSDTAQQFLPLAGTGCADDRVSITPEIICFGVSGEKIDPSTYLGNPDFNKFDTNSVLVSVLGYHEFTETFSVEGVARYKDGEAEYSQSYIDFLGSPARTDPAGNGGRTWYRSEAGSEQFAVDLRARYEVTTGPFDHELFGGAAYQRVETDNDFLFASSLGVINIFDPVYSPTPSFLVDGSTPLFDGAEQTTEDYGFYLNDQISIGALKINLGVRYDNTSNVTVDATDQESKQEDDAFSFSAGLLYAFDFGLSPYVSFAESFQPVIGTDGLTANALKPREGQQWEGGLKYQPPGTQTYITVAYFDIEESNLPNPSSLITEPNSQQEGVGKVKGVEVEAQTRFGDFYVEGNYSYLDTQTADGVRFAYVADRQASAWVQYEPTAGVLEGLRLGAGIRYVGENESNIILPGATAPAVTVITDGIVLGDLLAAYGRERWELSLNIRNITDEEYYGTCLARGDCFVGEERTIVGRLTTKF